MENVLLYSVIFLYFAVLLAIGVAASRRVSGLVDFFAGGKRLRYWVVAFSARATGESSWLLLGLTGMGAAIGLKAMWVVVGEVLGVAAAWFLMARPFKAATDRYQSITVIDYLVSRFTTPETPRAATMLRLLSAGILALFVTVYVSAQIDATGKGFSGFLGWPHTTGALVGFGIVVAYTLFGGFVAVAWSDLFQGSLMLLGLVVLPIGAYLALEGDVWGQMGQLAVYDGATRTYFAPSEYPAAFTSLLGPEGMSVLNLLSIVGLLAIGLGFLGSPQIFVRFISIRDQKEIRHGRWVAVVFTILTDAGAVLAGMFGRLLIESGGGGPAAVLADDYEQLLPELVKSLFPLVVQGLFIAAVLAAIMSTIDSLLVVASSAAVRDVYQQTFRPNLSTEALTRLSRWVTLGLAVLAFGIAYGMHLLVPGRTIFWYVIFGFSGIAAAFCPMIVLALFWRRYNVYGALASIVTGTAAVPLFKFAVPQIPEVGPALSRMEELAPAFACSLAAGVVATWLTAAHDVAGSDPERESPPEAPDVF